MAKKPTTRPMMARASGHCRCGRPGCPVKIRIGDTIVIREKKWFLADCLRAERGQAPSVTRLTKMNAQRRLAAALAAADDAAKFATMTPTERRRARLRAAEQAVENEERLNLLAYGTADRI